MKKYVVCINTKKKRHVLEIYIHVLKEEKMKKIVDGNPKITAAFHSVENDVNLVDDGDLVPDYVSTKANILDSLGYGSDRKKMDQAHNMIIDKKVKLRSSAYASRNSKKTEVSPFDIEVLKTPTHTIESEIQAKKRDAIKRASIKDPEYRAVAEAFLDKIIPVLDKKEKELDLAILRAEDEYIKTMEKESAKVEKARNARRDFHLDVVKATWDKFKHANEGRYTTKDAAASWEIQSVDPLCFAPFSSREILTTLRLLRDEMKRLDAAAGK